MGELGRDIWRSSCPTPLPKQGHLKLFAKVHVQTAFEYLQGWRPHNFTGQPVPVLGHPCNIHRSAPICQAIRFVIKVCQVAQAQLPFGEAMLAIPDDFLVLNVPGDGFQDQLLHHLPRN